MKHSFTINLLSFKVIHELPNAWINDDYKNLLALMDYGDTSDLTPKELKEMCLLSLSDNEPEDAAKIILEYIFNDRLNKGQIDHLSNEIIEEKIWEEYAELSMHEEFYNTTQILYEAFNGKFPHPEAVWMKLKVTNNKPENLAILEKDTEATLIRLLTHGMPDNTLIKRLFEDQLQGKEFKDAKDIIWQYKKEIAEDEGVFFEIISSTYWLHDLKYVESFEAELQLGDEN